MSGLVGWWLYKLTQGIKWVVEKPEVSAKIQAGRKKAIHRGVALAARTQSYLKEKLEKLKAMRWVPPADDPAVKGTLLFEASRVCRACRKRIRAEAYQCAWCGDYPDGIWVWKYIERHRTKLGANFKNGKVQCPRCARWDLTHAYILGSDIGLWCPHCKDTLENLRGKGHAGHKP
jgi:hypothetical protein